jgi:hypothetical protein
MPLAYVAWRTGTTYRVVVQVRQAGNRFLGPLKGLQIKRARICKRLCLSRPGTLESKVIQERVIQERQHGSQLY